MKGSRKRKPEVVIFEEPTRKQRRENPKQQPKPSVQNHEMGNLNFKEIAREVRELGVSGFKRKDQRKYRQQQVQALGAKAPKKQKMPYPLLMKLKKIRDEKEQKQKELENAMGIFKNKKKSNNKPILNRSGRWVDKSNGLETGKQKNGIQKLKQKDISRMKKSKT